VVIVRRGKSRKVKWTEHASMVRTDKECVQNFIIHWNMYTWKVEKRDGSVTLKWMLGTQIMRRGSEWK
jgi:hypothetical protein